MCPFLCHTQSNEDKAVTNPLHVIDSTNMSQINVSCRETEEKELLSFMPDENTSIEEAVGGHGFAENNLKEKKYWNADSIKYAT